MFTTIEPNDRSGHDLMHAMFLASHGYSVATYETDFVEVEKEICHEAGPLRPQFH